MTDMAAPTADCGCPLIPGKPDGPVPDGFLIVHRTGCPSAPPRPKPQPA